MTFGVTMMATEPFMQRYDVSGTTMSVVIEEDSRVAYAYLLDAGTIVSDVWLYNIGDAPTQVDWQDRAQMPFPNPSRFCRDVPYSRLSSQSDVKCVMHSSQVDVIVDGELFARLKPGARPGWSKLASRRGPLALPLE